MTALLNRTGLAVAALAAAVGLTYAAVSAYWAVGGTAWLDTVGGAFQQWGRERGASALLVLWLVVGLKVIVALAAPIATGRLKGLPPWTSGRGPRVLSWIASVALIAYGGFLTVVGLLVQSGLVHPGPHADHRALRWHAYLWDPWFLVWGLAFGVSLWLTRSPASRIPLRPATS